MAFVQTVESNLKEIASQPNERRLWWVRRLYNLPPTDPRYLDLTDEQIDLEWEHYLIDHPDLASKESFVDPNYEEWVRQAEEEDRKISYKDEVREGSDEITSRVNELKALDGFDNREWEEVPIDE